MPIRLRFAISLFAFSLFLLSCAPKVDPLPKVKAQPINPLTPLTPERATLALKTMIRTNPEAFGMTSVTIKPEHSDRFHVDLKARTYATTIYSGSCNFTYEGNFEFRAGRWSAGTPSLMTIGMVRRR